jgi:hypothetical protein
MPERTTLQQAASDALAVQDACNLSGVVHGFARAMEAVVDDCRSKKQGSDEYKEHPIVIMFMDKLVSMTRWNGALTNGFINAYDDCKKMAGESVEV